jgi:quercetin dioxygenase-like cupin family protein
VVVHVRSGTRIVREGDTDHRVEPGDVVAVPAGVDRGVKADDGGRLEALLVTAPPPSDAEHEPVREGLRRGVFDPRDADKSEPGT